MKPLIVVSKENKASQNIKENILKIEKLEYMGNEFWQGTDFDIAQYAGSIVEIIPQHKAEYYIFASTHKSKSGQPSLTVHTPGNWGDADMGGMPKTLNIALPGKIKAALMKMHELNKKSLCWAVCTEVDHHGPTLDLPIMFAEIGSTDEEWKNNEAGFIVAQAIVTAIRCNDEHDAYIGFGGTHYAPKFTPIILKENKALGHMISGYSLEKYGIDDIMARQAMIKNIGKFKGAILDWKGMKGETRKKVIAVLDGIGILWEKA